MLDCRLSWVLWHLEISSSRRSDPRSVILILHHLSQKLLMKQGMNKILRMSQPNED